MLHWKTLSLKNKIERVCLSQNLMEKIVFSLNENFMMDYKVVTKKKTEKKANNKRLQKLLTRKTY